MQPEAVEYVIEPYRLYGPEFSFIQDLDCFLSEYDEGFLIPLQLGALAICHAHATSACACDTRHFRQTPACMRSSAVGCSGPSFSGVLQLAAPRMQNRAPKTLQSTHLP